MPQTPASGASPYCDAPTFLCFYDPRSVGELVRDDNTEATTADLLDDPVLATLLGAASFELETACVVGGRYLPADLVALGAAGGNGALGLAHLVADLAYGAIRRRRGLPVQELPQVVAAQKTIADLREGIAALPFLETEAAGLAVTSNYTPSDYLKLHQPTDQAHRFFGRRGQFGCSGPGFGGGGGY